MQTLTSFSHELATQVDALTKPGHSLATIAEAPLKLGSFPEADALEETHADAVSDMQQLLGQVKQAVTFAQDVTQVVASHYDEADKNIAAALGGS